MNARWLTLALAALLPLGGCADRTDPAPTAERETTTSDSGYSAQDAEFIETDTDGRARYRLRAARAHQDRQTRAVDLRDVELQLRSTNGNLWNISAERGHLPPRSRKLELAGDVRIEAHDALGPMVIRTASLAYDIDTARARAPGVVNLRTGAGELSAVAVAVDIKTRRLSLESKVHGHFTP